MTAAANDFESLDDVARNWVVRLVSGDVDQEALAAFKTWQAANDANAEAFERARGLYVDSNRYENLLRPRRSLVPMAKWAVAASLALLAVGFWGREAVFPPDYVAADGPAHIFALSDGTRVTLDGGSAIDVKIDEHGRAVQLLRGRAHFDVAHESRPFTVTAGDSVVTDIGTAFAVSRTGGRGDVAVTGGLVRVAADGEVATLGAGQRAAWNSRGKLKFGKVDPDSLGWLHGQIVLRDLPLRDAARELDRYIDGTVIVFGEVGNARVGGTFSTARASEGLDALARSQGAHTQRFWGITIVTAD